LRRKKKDKRGRLAGNEKKKIVVSAKTGKGRKEKALRTDRTREKRGKKGGKKINLEEKKKKEGGVDDYSGVEEDRKGTVCWPKGKRGHTHLLKKKALTLNEREGKKRLCRQRKKKKKLECSAGKEGKKKETLKTWGGRGISNPLKRKKGPSYGGDRIAYSGGMKIHSHRVLPSRKEGEKRERYIHRRKRLQVNGQRLY